MVRKIILTFSMILFVSFTGYTQNPIQIEVFTSIEKTHLPFHECEIWLNNTSVDNGVLITNISFENQLLNDKRYVQTNEVGWKKEGENYFRSFCCVRENETFYEIFIPPGGAWKFQRYLEFERTMRCNIKWQEINEQFFCSNILVNNPNPPEREKIRVTGAQGPAGPAGATGAIGATGVTGSAWPSPCSISSIHNVYSPYCKIEQKKNDLNSFNAVIVKDSNKFPLFSDSVILKEYSDGNYAEENCYHESNNMLYNVYQEKFSCANYNFCPPENRFFQLYPDVFVSYLPSANYSVDILLEVHIIQIDSNSKIEKVIKNKISYKAILHLQKTIEEGFSVTLNSEYSDLFQIPIRYNIVRIRSSEEFIKLMTRSEELGSTLRFNRWNCNWYGLSMRTAN